METAGAEGGWMLDLRGEVCPLNYLKTRRRLTDLDNGERLEVWLDPGRPVESVARSSKDDGQKIVSIKKEADYYRLVIEKRA